MMVPPLSPISPTKGTGSPPSNPAATMNGKQVTAIVVGGGVTALSTARQLNGLEYTHTPDSCQLKERHAAIAHGQRIYQDQLPDDLSTCRGSTPSGCWFDSFRHTTLDEAVNCLAWQENNARAVDWILISKSKAGGSWNSYDPNQKTISPDTWMALPDAPIDGNNQNLTRHNTPHFAKTDAASLCRYYQDYANNHLPQERMFFNRTVTTAYPKENLWHVELDDQTQVSCQYLILANGRMMPKSLKINGENNNPNVSHTTAQAIQNISHLKPGDSILVIGTGLSAADTMMDAMRRKLKVTHILPREHTRLEAKYRPNQSYNPMKSLSPESYKEHHALAELISGKAESEHYQQLINHQLLEIRNDTCILRTGKEEEITQKFDHYAILIGSAPDFSFMKNANGTLLDFDAEELEPETMETQISNLFLAGSCTGEKFQRFSLGHSVSVAETIKDRESKKSRNQ